MMADQRTIAQLLQAPTEGYEDVIVVPVITVDNFELQHGLLTLDQNKQFFRHEKEDPHAHIRYFNKITSTLKFPNVSNTNNQNRFNQNQFRGINFNHGPVYQPPVFQPPAYQAPAYQALAPQTQGVSKEDFSAYVKANDAYEKYANSSSSTSSSGTLPSNTIANPRSDLKAITTRSGVSYDGPQIPPPPSFLPNVVENELEATMDIVHPTNNGSTKYVQPLVVQSKSLILTSEPINSLIIELVASPLRNKANDQREKFFQIFKDLNFNISFADALILMTKFGPSIKSLLTNKDKLCELARTPLNEHCSAVLLEKLPEKLGNPGKFLIPCDFLEKVECLALADLDASINLMPLFVWNKLSLPNLTPTCMNLELADRSISCPIGVAEDVYVKVGTFYFLTDFVVVDFDADPRVPLILMSDGLIISTSINTKKKRRFERGEELERRF
nr:reverse transcriptase domain-containing protein [Tanacetum cinerariifolium]